MVSLLELTHDNVAGNVGQIVLLDNTSKDMMYLLQQVTVHITASADVATRIPTLIVHKERGNIDRARISHQGIVASQSLWFLFSSSCGGTSWTVNSCATCLPCEELYYGDKLIFELVGGQAADVVQSIFVCAKKVSIKYV